MAAQGPVSQDALVSLDRMIEAYTACWRLTPPPQLPAFYADVCHRTTEEGHDPLELLVELVRIDLTCRWEADEPQSAAIAKDPIGPRPWLERYLALFPQLGPARRIPVELITVEYRTRLTAGEQPTHAEYFERFPRQADLLKTLLAAIDRERQPSSGELSTVVLLAREVATETGAADVSSVGVNSTTVGVSFFELVQQAMQLELAPREELEPYLHPEAQQRFITENGVGELIRQGHLSGYQVGMLMHRSGHELVFDRYRIYELIDRGGMGVVYKARGVGSNSFVALKTLGEASLKSTSDPLIARRRFEREAAIGARLDHEHVAQVYGSWHRRETPYLVMEYVEGVTLRQMVKQQGGLPLRQALSYLRQAAEGLGHCHQKGVIHRDIKPSNLIIDRHGRLKLLDFGLARDLRAPSSLDECENFELTRTGMLLGTVDFISPEQADDARLADTRSDIYSLGCTLFYLLTGVPMYRGGALAVTLHAHRREPVPRLAEFVRETPEEVQRLLDRMVAKKPGQRFQHMYEVVDAIDQILASPEGPSEPGEDAPRSWWSRVRQWLMPARGESQFGSTAAHRASLRRWRTLIGLATGGLIVFVVTMLSRWTSVPLLSSSQAALIGMLAMTILPAIALLSDVGSHDIRGRLFLGSMLGAALGYFGQAFHFSTPLRLGVETAEWIHHCGGFSISIAAAATLLGAVIGTGVGATWAGLSDAT